MNHDLAQAAPADAHQIDLLQMLAPFVLIGRADLATETRWVEHAGRLVDEARLWREGAALIAERYLGGHDPLFHDVAACLESLQSEGEKLLRVESEPPRWSDT